METHLLNKSGGRLSEKDLGLAIEARVDGFTLKTARNTRIKDGDTLLISYQLEKPSGEWTNMSVDFHAPSGEMFVFTVSRPAQVVVFLKENLKKVERTADAPRSVYRDSDYSSSMDLFSPFNMRSPFHPFLGTNPLDLCLSAIAFDASPYNPLPSLPPVESVAPAVPTEPVTTSPANPFDAGAVPLPNLRDMPLEGERGTTNHPAGTNAPPLHTDGEDGGPLQSGEKPESFGVPLDDSPFGAGRSDAVDAGPPSMDTSSDPKAY